MEYRKDCDCVGTSTAGTVKIGSMHTGPLKVTWKTSNHPTPKCDKCGEPWEVVTTSDKFKRRDEDAYEEE